MSNIVYLHAQLTPIAQCDEISAVPEARRVQHFSTRFWCHKIERARQAARLKVGDKKIAEKLVKTSNRLDRVTDVLNALHKTQLGLTTSPTFSVWASQSEKQKQDRR